MTFTFGIITDGTQWNRVVYLINNIQSLKIPDSEIILIGGNAKFKNVLHIPFDETKKIGWITKKKNLIIQNATKENIVFLHDYIFLGNDWYKGFKKFGNNFKIVTNRIEDEKGRYRDWTLYKGYIKNLPIPQEEKDDMIKSNRCLIPYEFNHLSSYMYVSGAYFVAKKEVMLQEPLDESRGWGQAEDIEWCSRVKDKYGFKFNPYSKVYVLKSKNRVFTEITEKQRELLKNVKN